MIFFFSLHNNALNFGQCIEVWEDRYLKLDRKLAVPCGEPKRAWFEYI